MAQVVSHGPVMVWVTRRVKPGRVADGPHALGKRSVRRRFDYIGADIKTVQFGWPIGMPVVDHIDGDIWEVRTRLATRIARVLFALEGSVMILLHGFIKKERKTPTAELDLAKQRLKKIRSTT